MIKVNPSAPPSSAATAISEISVTFGVNFARIGTSTASLTAFDISDYNTIIEESIISSASLTPSLKLSTFPATYANSSGVAP